MAIEPREAFASNGPTAGSTDRRSVPRTIPGRRALGLAVSGSLLAASGVVMIMFRYVLVSADAFSAYPHPLWPLVVGIHICSTPLFFFFVGSIWWRHVVCHWQSRRRRPSGVGAVALLVVVAFSGYVLYFVGSDRWLSFWRIFHAGAGVAAMGLYIYHAVVGWRAVSRRNGLTDRPARQVFR